MARYIDADELKKRINSRIGYFELYYPIDTANISELQNCLKIIDNAQTEEVQPIVRGKWEWNGDYICSECGSISSRTKYPFCPNCGAKMVESEKGE